MLSSDKLKVIFSFQTEKAAAASQHSKISLNPEHPLYNEVILLFNGT